VKDEWLLEVEDSLLGAHPLERVPPLLLQFAKLNVKTLRVFESDLQAIQIASTQPKRVGMFLRDGLNAGLDSERQWLGGCAELALCSSLLDEFPGRVDVDPVLPNGKRSEASIRLDDDTRVWIECTVLSISNDEYESLDRYAYVQARCGDPYQDARRFYRKVFDKVVGSQKSTRSQLHPVEPSVIVVVEGSLVTPGLGSLGVEWAIDQLLDPSKRRDNSGASIVKWARHDYGEAAEDVLELTRHISALCLAGYRNSAPRFYTNFAADDAHALTGSELAEMKRALRSITRPWS
jgi:hypothetical protein